MEPQFAVRRHVGDGRRLHSFLFGHFGPPSFWNSTCWRIIGLMLRDATRVAESSDKKARDVLRFGPLLPTSGRSTTHSLRLPDWSNRSSGGSSGAMMRHRRWPRL